jgi:hypothetical protein
MCDLSHSYSVVRFFKGGVLREVRWSFILANLQNVFKAVFEYVSSSKVVKI